MSAVRDLALGLAASGFKRGEKLSVIGDNRPRLYMAQIAAQCFGGVAVPVYQDSIAAELVYVLEHAEVSVIVVEDQEQVDKILSLKDRLPHLRFLIYDDPLGHAAVQRSVSNRFEEIHAAGRDFGAKNPGFVERRSGKAAGDDLALLAYTSGTTGRLQGRDAVPSQPHRQRPRLSPRREDIRRERRMAVLPAYGLDRRCALFDCAQPAGRIHVQLSGKPRTVQRDLRELGPTAWLAPPRIWENMLTSVQVRAADASLLKRKLFEIFRASPSVPSSCAATARRCRSCSSCN